MSLAKRYEWVASKRLSESGTTAARNGSVANKREAGRSAIRQARKLGEGARYDVTANGEMIKQGTIVRNWQGKLVPKDEET